MNDEPITITLELRVAGDSVSGRARNGSGPAGDFSSWLGLVSAIEALVDHALALRRPGASDLPADSQESSMSSLSPFHQHEAALRHRCRGAVVAPGDDGYDGARQVFNLTVDQRP